MNLEPGELLNERTRRTTPSRSIRQKMSGNEPALSPACELLQQELDAAMLEISDDLHDLHAELEMISRAHGYREQGPDHEHSSAEWKPLMSPTSPRFRGLVRLSAHAGATGKGQRMHALCTLDHTNLKLEGGVEWNSDLVNLPLHHLEAGIDDRHPDSFSIKVDTNVGPETRIFMAAQTPEACDRWLRLLAQEGVPIRADNGVRIYPREISDLESACPPPGVEADRRCFPPLVVWI